MDAYTICGLTFCFYRVVWNVFEPKPISCSRIVARHLIHDDYIQEFHILRVTFHDDKTTIGYLVILLFYNLVCIFTDISRQKYPVTSTVLVVSGLPGPELPVLVIAFIQIVYDSIALGRGQLYGKQIG